MLQTAEINCHDDSIANTCLPEMKIHVWIYIFSQVKQN